jgi:hypothetical protein
MNLQSPRRAAAVVSILAAALAAVLLAAGCSDSPPSSGSGSTPNAGASGSTGIPVAYSRCMRSHGIPNFPDPNSSGQISKRAMIQLGVSTSVLQSAQQACERLWPYQAPTQAQQRQQLAQDLTFARCMRAHGVPDFPDPTSSGGSGGQPEFVISLSRVGMSESQLLAKAHECQHVLPAGSPLPHATLAS